ncbi:hypothetical protein JCM11641_006354 [Rhodosporidiobolus odoratus]
MPGCQGGVGIDERRRGGTDPLFSVLADEVIGWAIAAGVCYAGYKLLFADLVSPPPPPSSDTYGTGSGSSRRQITQEQIDQLTSVFPHVTERAARWELERNGASVERAVERALREGGLPEPPASYLSPTSTGPIAAAAGAATPIPANPAASSSSSTSRGPPPSLIQRMGLQSRAAMEEKGKGKAREETGDKVGWSPDSRERERRLRERKEKLVLEARRKLLEKRARSGAPPPTA